MSRQSHRRPEGGRIDRLRPIDFTFDGRTYTGFVGDSLASALLANGVRLVGRSFKYHRPRGIIAAGSEEPNALVQLGEGARSTPNLRATEIELYDGLVARSQNRWPCLAFDIFAIHGWMHRILPSGFYYKTFMWPRSGWLAYEKLIRRAAGLGKAPSAADPDRYEKVYGHCDVLVIGAGPAGIAAALAAGRSGARVMLVDEGAELGGSLLAESAAEIDGRKAGDWLAAAIGELAAMPEVALLPRTTAWAYFDHNMMSLLERVSDHLPPGAKGPRQRLWRVRAKEIVLATGALERPLVHRDNDKPGVMLADAARVYLQRYGVKPGRRAILMTNNDSAYRAALELAEGGVEIAALLDLRPQAEGPLAEACRRAGIEILNRQAIVAVHGRERVCGVSVASLDGEGKTVTGEARRIACDLVLTSGGWQPSLHLSSQTRAKPIWDEALQAFLPGPTAPGQRNRSLGGAAGRFALADCLKDGHEGGKAAAAACGFAVTAAGEAPVSADASESQPLQPCWVVPSTRPIGEGGKHFVDFQNDVTAADVMLAHREGYLSVEHLKRYTTMGMATDQGKTSNVNALAIMAELRGLSIPEVGVTTFRPPYTPVTFGAFAGPDKGDFLDPIRTTPLHQWHEDRGALFEPVGQWRRAWYYPKAGESMSAAVNREVYAARHAIGIFDASTLGKIDIKGKDAAWFLNMVYTNAWTKLEAGRCRYGLMCGEDGMVFDDGVTSRLAEDHFHMTTTTGGAPRVLGWLEEWHQCEWPEREVFFTSVTEQWAVIALNGPYARQALAKLTEDIPLDDAAFPFMSFRDGHVAGVKARIFRISFTGELSFEINVPPSFARHVWQALMQAGEEFGITPYGTEAMHVLRAEKGFVIVGQETDGTITPQDLGMDWIIGKAKPDFIGRRSHLRSDTARSDRKHLVGLLTEDPKIVLPEGAQIVAETKPKPPMAMIGHVTSSYWSANLDRSIALALVKNGRARLGETIYLPYDNRIVAAKIVAPKFLEDGAASHG